MILYRDNVGSVNSPTMFQIRTYHTPMLKPSQAPKNPAPAHDSLSLRPLNRDSKPSILTVDELAQNPEYIGFKKPDDLTTDNLSKHTRMLSRQHGGSMSVSESALSESDDEEEMTYSRQNVVEWLQNVGTAHGNITLTLPELAPESSASDFDDEVSSFSSPGSSASHLVRDLVHK